MAYPPENKRETVVVSNSSNAGAWIFGIVVAVLVAIGVWYYASVTGPDTSVTIESPSSTTNPTTGTDNSTTGTGTTTGGGTGTTTGGGTGTTDETPAPSGTQQGN